MKIRNWIVGIGSLVLVGSAVVVAEDAKPDAAPAPTATPAPKVNHTRAKLPKDYSEIPDLTEEEKTKLLDIHEKALQDAEAIHLKEIADMKDVLTPDQQKELADIDVKLKDAGKAKKNETHMEEKVKSDQEKLNEAKQKLGEPTTNPADAK